MKSSRDEGSLLTPNGAWAFAVFDKEDRGSNLLGLLLTNDACALSLLGRITKNQQQYDK